MTDTQSALRTVFLTVTLCSAFSAFACQNSDAKKQLAPEAKSLEPTEKAAKAESFDVSADSSVSFEMDAELEHISGRAPKAASGTLNLPLSDVTKSTGIVKIDLLALSIYQKKRESADAEFGEEELKETQNAHMRTWLQISEDGPKEEREKNRFIEFQIKELRTSGPTDLTQMKGIERKLALTITGDLRLHGRVTSHTFRADATFIFEGDRAISMKVTSREPLSVDLEKHDVRPRSAFNILADKTLAALGTKVAKVALVSFTLDAKTKERNP